MCKRAEWRSHEHRLLFTTDTVLTREIIFVIHLLCIGTVYVIMYCTDDALKNKDPRFFLSKLFECLLQIQNKVLSRLLHAQFFTVIIV